MFKNDRRRSGKAWPADCVWPEPLYDGEGIAWDSEDAELCKLDEEGYDLLEIKEYFDELVKEGRLNEDYSLNDEYEDADQEDDFDEEFEPEIGEEYWVDGFDLDMWEEDMSEHLNLLKIDYCDVDPTVAIYNIIGYQFVNENLLRQAFTRRAFAIEHGLSGCNEELEFLGDNILGSVVTREMIDHLTTNDIDDTEAPFTTRYNEGDLSKIRSRFVSKEYLSERAVMLGLDAWILYGTGETPNESSREDMMEALIGAVAIDSGWNWQQIDAVVDRLICIQLSDPDGLLRKSYYEIFNSWHQRKFGVMPDYDIHGVYNGKYDCVLRYFIPENDKGIWRNQIVAVTDNSRSRARELAAEEAYHFVYNNGLWMNLRDAGIVPDKENSINQLQELYQKKYLNSIPVYEFEELAGDRWQCDCHCDGMYGFGRAGSKTKAKKKAAYMMLIHLLVSAGICEKEWQAEMYDFVLDQ